MARTVGIGIQDFEKIITNHFFYIDKTSFIKEWWESGDDATLLAKGVPSDKIYKYGFAFDGKTVLIEKR